MPFSCTRVPVGKLPPLEIDADNNIDKKLNMMNINNVNQYLPPLDHGLKHINKLRDQDAIFKQDE